jgi:tetratricopeptide (TPR) repeat protein
MLNVPELERRYKTYKLKLLIPYFAISAALMVILLSGLFIFSYEFEPKTTKIVQEQHEEKHISQNKTEMLQTAENSTTQTKEEAAIPAKEPQQVAPITAQNSIEAPKIKSKENIDEREKVVLSPSLNFINNIKMQTSNNPKSQSDKNVKIDNETEKSASPKHKKEQTAPVIVEEVKQPIVAAQKKQEVIAPLKNEEVLQSTPKIEAKSEINIKRKNDDDIRDVINRFNTNHNPALSLFVAKKYYQNGDYEQAYNYALMTNEINNNIEESWIIFSKSLVKMNKKDEAQETLKKYIAHSHSSQAKQLLDEIGSGKFK